MMIVGISIFDNFTIPMVLNSDRIWKRFSGTESVEGSTGHFLVITLGDATVRLTMFRNNITD
jgi:hypothetical protein